MNFVIHSLSGALLARAVPERHRSGGVVAGMAAAACMPDIDCVSVFWGMDTWHLVHRGVTHSLAGVLATSLLLALAYCAFFGGFRRTVVFAWIAVAQYLHVFLDLLNPYGVHVFLPFSNSRVALGTDIPGNSVAVLAFMLTGVLWTYRVELGRFVWEKLGWSGSAVDETEGDL